ncbi:MAG: type IV pilus assembly protein PilM [Fimbriimonas sp.]|nr:type IV pilus assembly protein PilM [Fimbriimonas sp.]
MLFERASVVHDHTMSMGVDFGTRSTKILMLNQVGARTDIGAAGSFVPPTGSIKNGLIEEPKEFGRNFGRYLRENQVPCPTAVFDIPSNLAVLRWVTLPLMEESEIRDAARFKVRKHLPFPLDSAYVEAATAKIHGDEISALVVATPRNIVDSRSEALLYAGLEPIRAELEAQAILRVVERRLNRRSALWRDASLTIIDLGSSNTHMYVVQNQQLQFIRGVKFGSSMFHTAVREALNLSPEIADTVMHDPRTSLSTKGVLNVPLGDDYGIVDISEPLEKLTREVMRLMRYFRSLHPERSYAGILDQAILCGGLVSLPGLADYLQKQLGLRIEFARPISGMMTRFNRETFASVSHRQEAYTIVMGLALGGLSQTTQNRSQQDGGREFNWIRVG